MQITAAIARAPGADFTLEAVELDDPRPDEILVAMAIADGGRIYPRCGQGPVR